MGLFVPLDADYDSDDKIIEAGPMAELLFIRALVFCKRKASDGIIRAPQLAIVGRGIPNVRKHATTLVDVGLWVDRNDGWQIRTFLKRNRSSADIQAQRDLASEAGIRGNHERWHVGPEGKPSSKCPICRSEHIGVPDRPPIGSLSPESETEPKPITEPEPEPLTEPKPEGTSSSQHNSHLALVPEDDDDFHQAIEQLVTSRCQGRHITNERSYRAAVRREALELDGEAIRQRLQMGLDPHASSQALLGLEGPAPSKPIRWCPPDCPTCDGTAFVDTGSGYAPCPERTAS